MLSYYSTEPYVSFTIRWLAKFQKTCHNFPAVWSNVDFDNLIHYFISSSYSNGHVRVWDDDDDCTFIPSNTALAINELAECGTVSNIINRVCVNGHLAAASYSQG